MASVDKPAQEIGPDLVREEARQAMDAGGKILDIILDLPRGPASIILEYVTKVNDKRSS